MFLDMSDYYEILQVHPNADQEAIRDAYERLRQRYAPDRLEGAAEELVDIARQKRDAIERSYAILGDLVRREQYDEELRAQAEARTAAATTASAQLAADVPEAAILDYSPLPPAKHEERPRNFNTQPVSSPRRVVRRSGRQAKQALPFWVRPAAVVGGLTFTVILVSFLVTDGGRPTPATGETNGPAVMGTPGSIPNAPDNREVMDQFEGQIIAARQVTEQAPDNVNAWVNLGNALYDSVQIVRERLPNSEIYDERLPRWLEASEAYEQALQLDPTNFSVRSDLAVSLCKYGEGANDQTYVERGLSEARQAADMGPEDARILLNLGVCLVNTDPPQQQEALEQWLKVLDLPSASRGAVVEAQQLIEEFSQ